MPSLTEIYRSLIGLKSTPEKYSPLLYTLRPVRWLYPDKQKGVSFYSPLGETDSGDLEDHLMKLLKSIQRLKYWFDYEVTELHLKHFQRKLEKVQEQWQNLQQEYQDEIRRLRELTLSVYRGAKASSIIKRSLEETNETSLKENLRKLTNLIDVLKGKTKLIKDLQQKHINYCNIADQEVYQNMDEEAIEHVLKKNDYDQVFCCSDDLKNGNDSDWEKISSQLHDKYETNENLRFLYADFSYCSFDLSKMALLTTTKNTRRNKSTEDNITSSSSKSSLSQTEHGINILLLGESGVGKSTFINALCNYLKYETLRAAESNSLVVLIPVFFVMTTGSNFDEKIVKFGDLDKLKNEEFSQLGESVTQYCKSYVFTLHDTDGKKIRIIDTPGFGDTRGIEQDEFNMQHILKYLSNLTHLNAVCFLLKPNASEMNKSFKICLTHLLDFFGEDISQNIIFCFTNARSTFYVPGDTAPLLKELLQSLSIKTKIPFQKENTFCFDNESFRYLVALQNSVTFDDHQRDEYKKSWSKSAINSKRFINYICDQLSTHEINNEHQSIRHAHITITNMIRPMLETLRYIVRNFVLWETNKIIELKPKKLNSLMAICLKCKYDSIEIGPLRIRPDNPHKIRKICTSCPCALDQHQRIDYELEYEYSDRSSTHEKKKMEKTLERISDASVQFAHFLMLVNRSKDDPFFVGITQMIIQENDIHKREKSGMNKQLAQALRNLLNEYEQQMNDTQPNQRFTNLSRIYSTIQSMNQNFCRENADGSCPKNTRKYHKTIRICGAKRCNSFVK